MIRRTDQGALAEWWWTVDRLSFFLISGLICIGLMLAMAVSPTVNGAGFLGGFGAALKQIAFAVFAMGILIGASMLTPAQAFRVATIVFAVALVATLFAALAGSQINSARRWIKLFGMTIQPSEFLKPGFAVLSSAILTARIETSVSKPTLTLALIVPVSAILMLQPDFGQIFLLLALWATVLFFVGASYRWFFGIGAAAIVILALAYRFADHVRTRIDQFFDHSVHAYQATQSLRAFAHGGLVGVGPGAGTVKYRLPEAHSDYIFAVAGEEFGLVLCVAIAVMFCVLTVRMMRRSAGVKEPFVQLAGASLSMVVALQAFINMSVAIRLLPSKGMTLPFISYGGSSLFAVALTMGLALAMTRERPVIGVRQKPFDLFAWGQI